MSASTEKCRFRAVYFTALSSTCAFYMCILREYSTCVFYVCIPTSPGNTDHQKCTNTGKCRFFAVYFAALSSQAMSHTNGTTRNETVAMCFLPRPETRTIKMNRTGRWSILPHYLLKQCHSNTEWSDLFPT